MVWEVTLAVRWGFLHVGKKQKIALAQAKQPDLYSDSRGQAHLGRSPSIFVCPIPSLKYLVHLALKHLTLVLCLFSTSQHWSSDCSGSQNSHSIQPPLGDLIYLSDLHTEFQNCACCVDTTNCYMCPNLKQKNSLPDSCAPILQLFAPKTHKLNYDSSQHHSLHSVQ